MPNRCDSGYIELVDASLGDLVERELERIDVPFARIDKARFCYESRFHSEVTQAVIAARSVEHPIGRIDVVGTVAAEVKKALDAAGIRYSASMSDETLVLFVSPTDLRRANELIDKVLAAKY